ncbi:hypothetical protein BH11MYX3_BH11MYX3_39700 [soil metagenome]
MPAMRRSCALALLLLTACPAKRVQDTTLLADPVGGTDGNVISAMIAELQDDVLTAYERDEPPEIETSMIPPEIGGARIGVGPGDVLIAGELERAPSRWPLRLERDTAIEVHSKRLETHLAQDLSAAWVADALSWRVRFCGRTAVIPLRITMLYARDGDRWVPVFEHTSFGHTPSPRRDGTLYGSKIPAAVVSGDLRDALARVASPLLFNQLARDPSVIATGPEAMVLGPDITSEWHGADVLHAQLAAGRMTAENRRIGTVGRSPGTSTIAYWIGNVVADLPARPGVAAGKSRLRATMVFEKRRFVPTVPGSTDPNQRPEAKSCGVDSKDCRWVLVQAHVSQPIGDQDLATRVFGTALLSTALESGESLKVTCDDGNAPGAKLDITVPEAAPRRPAAAGGTP